MSTILFSVSIVFEIATRGQTRKRPKSRDFGRIREFLELLGRFELPTSSLPNLISLLCLVVSFCSLSQFPLVFQRVQPFTCCNLSQFVMACCMGFCGARMGFVWVFHIFPYAGMRSDSTGSECFRIFVIQIIKPFCPALIILAGLSSDVYNLNIINHSRLPNDWESKVPSLCTLISFWAQATSRSFNQ